MPDIARTDPPFFIEWDLKGKDAQHLFGHPAHCTNAATSPRPELGGNIKNDGHAEPAEALGQAQVEVRRVDEHGDVRSPAFRLPRHIEQDTTDPRKLADNLDQTHVCEVIGVSDRLEPLPREALATDTESINRGGDLLQFVEQISGVNITGNLTCDDQNGAVPHRRLAAAPAINTTAQAITTPAKLAARSRISNDLAGCTSWQSSTRVLYAAAHTAADARAGMVERKVRANQKSSSVCSR
jgi:hypothetical protein